MTIPSKLFNFDVKYFHFGIINFENVRIDRFKWAILKKDRMNIS